MESKFEWGLVTVFSIMLLSMSVMAFAEPGEKSTQGTAPYIDHVREYYESKQQLVQKGIMLTHVYYDSFSLNIPLETNCGWTEIIGQVPYAGMVTVSVYEKTLMETDNGQERLSVLLFTQNINSNPAQLLRGYIDLPCNDEPTKYRVILGWQETPYEIFGLYSLSYNKSYVIVDILVI